MSEGAAQKVACKNCQCVDVPAFDGKCQVCAAPLQQKGNGMTKEELQSLLPLPEEEAATEGYLFADSPEAALAVEGHAKEDPYCGFCGFDVSEEEVMCPRCALPLSEQEDDEEDGEDKEGGEEGDDEEGEKKLLLDKSRRKAESFNRPQSLTSIEEATFYVDLARQLDESQIKDLAAHVAWSDQESLADKTPRWLPEQYRVDWSKLVNSGRPKTMMSAITALRGVVGSRGSF